MDKLNFPYVDGAGYSPQVDAKIYQGCKYSSRWPYGLLLGRIGSIVFPIGRGISFTASQTGTLELSINDQISCLADNAGSLYVKAEEGLDVKNVLDQVILNDLRNLTPTERQRLALYAKNSVLCGAAGGNPFSADCIMTVLGLFSFVLSPEPVE